jgi:hypothetical protein
MKNYHLQASKYKTGERHDLDENTNGSEKSGKEGNDIRVFGFYIAFVNISSHLVWCVALECLCVHVELGQHGA